MEEAWFCFGAALLHLGQSFLNLCRAQSQDYLDMLEQNMQPTNRKLGASHKL